MAQLLGFKFIIKFLTNNLSLTTIEDRIYKLTNYKGKAIVLEYPEVGFDIDNLSHLDVVNKIYSTSDLKIN